MRLAIWVAAGICGLSFTASSASAQSSSSRDFSPSNLSSALTGVKPGNIQFRTPDGKALSSAGSAPASTASKPGFSLGSLFPRLSGTSVNKGPQQGTNVGLGIPTAGNAFQPATPVMSTVVNPGRAIGLTGSASTNRGSSFQIPTPITGR